MKIVDTLSKVSLILILIVLTVGVVKISNMGKSESNYYEYNNMKINLAQIETIKPRVDYIITYKEDANIDIFRKYSTSLNIQEIENIRGFLKLAQKSEFYNVQIVAYMMLDTHKVELYRSQHYLKYPATYSVNDDLLSRLSGYGLDDFQYKNLLKLKDIVYKDVNKFFDDVVSYAKLKKSNWAKENIPELGRGANANKFMQNIDSKLEEKSLTLEDIEEIVESMKDAHEKYLGIN